MPGIYAAFLFTLPLTGATLPKAAPEEVGISADRLTRVSALMKRYIDNGEIAGSVTLVARKGRIAHLEAQGVMDLNQVDREDCSLHTFGDTTFHTTASSSPSRAFSLASGTRRSWIKLFNS